MYNYKLTLDGVVDGFLNLQHDLSNKGFSILLFSSLFISMFLLYSVDYIANSDAAFCKDVKYKDDGDNGYRIYIGTSTVGIDDCIIGSNHKDVIIGGDGDDHIQGKKGDDNLQGRFNNDRILGNDDDDTIQGGPGGDYLYGNDDDDVIFAGFDSDFLSGVMATMNSMVILEKIF